MKDTMTMEEAARRLRALDVPASHHIIPYDVSLSYRTGKYTPNKVKHKLIFDCPNGQALVFVNHVDDTIDVGQLAAFGLKLASLGGTDIEEIPYNPRTSNDRNKYLGGRKY